MQIEITTKHTESKYGMPVCLIDGELVESSEGFKKIQEFLGLTNFEIAELTGKSTRAVDYYRNGSRVIPAEVWLMLKDMLERKYGL